MAKRTTKKKEEVSSQWRPITDLAVLIKLLQVKATIINKIVDDENIELRTYDFDGFLILTNSNVKFNKVKVSDGELICDYLKIAAPSSTIFKNGYALYAYNNGDEYMQLITFSKNEIRIYDSDETNILIDPNLFKDGTIWDTNLNEKFNEMNTLEGISAVGRVALNFRSNFSRITQEIASLMGLVEKYTQIRKQLGSRLVADIYTSLGSKEYHKFCERNGIDTKNGIRITDYIAKLYKEYETIRIEKLQGKRNDQVTPVNFNKIYSDPSPIIPTYKKYVIVSAYMSSVKEEAKLRKAAEDLVTSTKLWNEYLSGIRGVGWTTAGHIMANLDPYKARHPSGFIAYCGLDTRPNEKGKRVAVSKKYPVLKRSFIVDKNGEFKIIDTLGCNLLIKSFLCEVMMNNIIKAGKGYYRNMYDDVKNRYTNRFANDSTITKLRIERMTKRKVASQFLIDLWVNWRKLEGLETHDDYAKAKLGITHGFPGYDPNHPDMG